MTKRTKTKAAQAASRVLRDADEVVDILYGFNEALMLLGGYANNKKFRKLWRFIENSKTAAASALSQKE